MTTPVFVTRIPIARLRGPLRQAEIPAGGGTITYGVHGEIARFYDVDTNRWPEQPSPLDHFVAVVGTALIGGFGRDLGMEGVPCDDGLLTGVATGHLSDDEGVLFIGRVDVDYRLEVDDDVDRDAVARAFDHHVPACPITRTLGDCVELRLAIDLLTGDDVERFRSHGDTRG